jgi:hypothetical protein
MEAARAAVAVAQAWLQQAQADQQAAEARLLDRLPVQGS